MKAIRLVLRQSSANYRKEESNSNKMTYPLPPFSTVIGALHVACSFKEYHPMDLSIQGNYESMHREAYTDHCFLNSIMDDRGILVKMKSSSLLSTAFDRVATAKKSQGNSFRDGKTIHVHNQGMLDEYRALKDLRDQIQVFKNTRIKRVIERIKQRKVTLSKLKKSLDHATERYTSVVHREKEIQTIEKRIKKDLKDYETENYMQHMNKFRSLVTSIKYYEILNNINLIIHVRADEDTMSSIMSNVYNLKSIGRSEDFVEVLEAKVVVLSQREDVEIYSKNHAYIGIDHIINDQISQDIGKLGAGREMNGTKYYLPKNYTIMDHKRVFETRKVLYTSDYAIEETSEHVWLDLEDEQAYIVNLL